MSIVALGYESEELNRQGTDASLRNESPREARRKSKGLLRFITCGSVDDGKSTLIGRLLYDSQSVHEDHLIAAGRASGRGDDQTIDLSLLTDGLRAEREQRITIDVAFRYFATPRRKFILGDAPGHEQYTRNMATAASTADLALILVDVRHGIRTQTRRHARIATLLGIRDLIVVVNKMDLVAYDEKIYRKIERDFRRLAATLAAGSLRFIPTSAMRGANVVRVDREAMPWYDGPSLLELLEDARVDGDRAVRPFFFPVQRVVRPHHDFRGYAGRIADGSVRVGDRVVIAPSGLHSKVRRIVTFDGDLESAKAPMSVTLALEDELDISRGDALCATDSRAVVSRRLEVTLIWLGTAAQVPGTSYVVRQATRTARAVIRRLIHAVDVDSARTVPVRRLAMNAIAVVELETSSSLVVTSYEESRTAGGLILIDPVTNETVAAGMIRRALDASDGSGADRRAPDRERLIRRLRRIGGRGMK